MHTTLLTLTEFLMTSSTVHETLAASRLFSARLDKETRSQDRKNTFNDFISLRPFIRLFRVVLFACLLGKIAQSDVHYVKLITPVWQFTTQAERQRKTKKKFWLFVNAEPGVNCFLFMPAEGRKILLL